MKKISLLLCNKVVIYLAPLVLLCLAGCYHVGSIAHPELESVAIAPVVNETAAYNVSAQMRQLLCEQFMTDGSLQLKDLDTADCIVNARIVSVQFREISDDSNDDNIVFLPSEWTVQIHVEFSVIIPGKATSLVSQRKVTGTTDFQVQADLETNRERAIQQAARDAAQQIVTYTTEAW